MKIGDVYYEKHTVTKISSRTNTVSETQVEIVNILPIEVLDKIRADVINIADSRRSMPVRSVINIIDKYKVGSEDNI